METYYECGCINRIYDWILCDEHAEHLLSLVVEDTDGENTEED